MVDILKFQTLVACTKAEENNTNLDKTVSEEAVWSGSSLFSALTSSSVYQHFFKTG